MSSAQAIRKNIIAQLKQLRPENITPFSDDSIEENYTLVVKPDQNTCKRINKTIKQLNNIDPDQYYYVPKNLHLTLIGRLPVKINQTKLVSTINKIIKKYSLAFQLKGVGSNHLCSSITAYPNNFSIHELRDEIRGSLGVTGDDYQKHISAYEHVGWINYMRYTHTPSQKLLDKLYSLRNTVFGTLEPNSAYLYKNHSKILNPKTRKCIKKFILSCHE